MRRACLVLVFLLGLCNATATGAGARMTDETPLYSPFDMAGVARTWVSPGTDGSTKGQDDTWRTVPWLFYSNNPEALTPSTMRPGRVAVLMRYRLLNDKPYRVYLGHTNATDGPVQVAVVIKGLKAQGTYSLTRRSVVVSPTLQWPTWTSGGVEAARRMLGAESAVSPSPVAVTGSWTGVDQVVTLAPNQNLQAYYDLEVTGGDFVDLAVVATPATFSPVSLMAFGLWDQAPKEAYSDANETGHRWGVFYSRKNVELFVNLDSLPADGSRAVTDQIGHYACRGQVNKSLDEGQDCHGWANDGWMARPYAWNNPAWGKTPGYLYGNFGTLYQYTVHFTGANADARGALLLGPNANSETPRPWGLALRQSDGSTKGLTMEKDWGTQAWLVARAVTPGSSVTFDVMVPGNVDLPYLLYALRYT